MPKSSSLPWSLFFSELIGTGILIAVGLSVVIFNFSQESPMARFIPDAGLRRLITGFLFGSTGALVAVSPLGKASGAHINPVVSMAFALMGKMRWRHALSYMAAQLAGGILGALPLLLWGGLGSSVHFGVTVPGEAYGAGWAFTGEVVTTFFLVAGLLLFVRHKKIRNFTPAYFPILYAVMVFWEAPISGTSTNPARTLGPEIISEVWRGWWVYWAGPAIGALIGVAVHRLPILREMEIEVAKLFHFEYDPHGIFTIPEPPP